MFRFFQPKFLLVLICAFFLITRVYKIAEIPPSLYWDEASIGYNAYSIAETGKDEWGESFPLHFRAFGEFKLPVYIYSVVPFVKIFGLNEFSVRFPSVLFSLGIVILTYILAKKLSNNAFVGLFSSFFITISPWFFIFSRTGYEAMAGLMFYLLAIYFFRDYNKNIWYILLSVLGFILSAYSYNSFRIIAPLTILILVLFEIRNLKSVLKKGILPLILSVIILIISIIPVYRLYVYDAGGSRLQVIGATKTTFIKNYISHFSPDFLLFSGDRNLRSQQGSFGQIFLPELILLLLGFISIINRKSRSGFLALFLLLIGPIPAAVTRESPHALRAISMIPFISIISAEEISFLGKIIKQKFIFHLMIIIIFLGFFINYFLNFLDSYPVQSSKDWQYPYKKVFTDFQDNFRKYDRIIISDEYAQPYIFALFYLKYDPDKFRQEVVRNTVDQWGFSTVSKFDKFEFGKVDKLLAFGSRNALIFTTDKISYSNPLNSIKLLDKETVIWVYSLD